MQTPTAITTEAIDAIFNVPCSAMIVNRNHGIRPTKIPAPAGDPPLLAVGADCDMTLISSGLAGGAANTAMRLSAQGGRVVRIGLRIRRQALRSGALAGHRIDRAGDRAEH